MESPIDFEIYDFYQPSLFDSLWVRIGIGLVIGLIIAGIIFFIIRRNRKPLRPGQVALNALQELSTRDFSNKKEVKAAYFAITTIIKRYLQEQFKYKVVDQTDGELILFLQEQKFHQPTLEGLKKIDHNALWVKFANYDLIKTQVESDVTAAREIIETLELLVEENLKKSTNNKK